MNSLQNFVNWKLTHADKTAEAEGYPLVMENCKANKKMKQLQIFGNSVQNGTPTPETPIEVQSVGEMSVNLFDNTKLQRFSAWNVSKAETTETGVLLTFEKTGNDGGATQGNYLINMGLASQYAGKTLMLSSIDYYSPYTQLVIMTPSNVEVKVGSKCTEKDGLYYSTLSIEEDTYTDELLIVRLFFGIKDLTKNSIEFRNLMLAENDIPLPYEPYGKYKIPIVTKGKNLFKPTSVSAASIRSNNNRVTTNDYGTTIDTTDLSDNKVVIAQVPNNNYDVARFQNGYFYIQTSGLIIGKQYKISFDVDIRDNPLGATYISILSPNGLNQSHYSFTSAKQRVKFTFTHTDKKHEYDYPFIEIRCMGMSFTASNFMITEVDFDESFEPYVEPIKTNVFLNEPLRKIGHYADCIDFANKKVIRCVGTDKLSDIPFNGKCGVSTSNSFFASYTISSGTLKNKSFISTLDTTQHNVIGHELCDKLPCLSYGTIKENNNVYGIIFTNASNGTANEIRVAVPKSVVQTLDEFRIWVANNDCNIFYVLLNQYEEPTECELPKLKAKTSIIEVDTSLAPGNAYGKYIRR